MLAKLPVELWSIILKPDYTAKFKVDIEDNGTVRKSPNQNLMHPNSPSYLQIRLVCQLFHDIITPHVFSHVLVQDEEYALNRLRDIAGTPGVAHHVKAYTFEFCTPHRIGILREGLPHTPVEIYTHFLALDEDDQANFLANLPAPQRRSLLRLAQIHQFLSSGELSREHVDYLSTLPNLRSLSLYTCNVPLQIVKAASGTQTAKSFKCGTDVLHALLETCYRRTLLSSRYTRIEKLFIEGLDRDCLLTSPQLIQQACKGMASIKDLSFSISLITVGSQIDLNWIEVLGRLLRSAQILETLSIFPCVEEEDIRAIISFKHLFVKKGMSVDKAGSAIPTKAEVSNNLISHHWTQLSTLSLQGVICELKPFLNFLKLHKPTLLRVSILQCATRLNTRSPPVHHGASHLDDTELSLEEKNKLNWTKVFRDLKSYEPISKNFESFCPKYLSAGTTGHIHMSNAESDLWQKYFEGKILEEPDWASLQEAFDDEDTGAWCPECTNDWDDEYDDDDEEMFDDDMMGMHPFGHSDFVGDMWDDEHDGNLWVAGSHVHPLLPFPPPPAFLDGMQDYDDYDNFMHGHTHHHHHEEDDDVDEDEEEDDDDDDEMPPLA